MLHFQRNYPHSTTASIPVSCFLSLFLSIECTQCAAILVACIPPFSRFFPPVSGCLLFFLLSSTDQSQSDGNQRFVGCNPFANFTRFFVDFHDPRRCYSNLVALADWLFHSQFRSTCSLKSPLSFDGLVQNDVSSIRSQIGAVSLIDLVHYGGRNLEDRTL